VILHGEWRVGFLYVWLFEQPNIKKANAPFAVQYHCAYRNVMACAAYGLNKSTGGALLGQLHRLRG